MGRFDIDIEPGQKYYAEWTDNTGKTVQSWLPAAKTTGISLKLTVQKEKLFYNLINKTGNDSLHVIMYMYQKVFYKTNLAVAEAQPHTGMVPLSGLPSGVMQLTVFNASWQPVSERIAFINTGNYLADAGISTSVVSTQKRGKNAWEIMVSDTVPANMSLSITDADMNALPIENSILSNMLLKGDLRGYVHNPAWYFSTSDPDSRAKLDLVMLTHGWRRYNWTDMVNQRVPAVKNQTDEYLGVYGQISKELLGKLDSEEQVNLIVKTKDSINSYYSVKPDKDGFLRQTGLVFYDSAKVYFSFNKNKTNNSQIAFGKYNFTSPPISFISNHRELLAPDTTGTSPKPGLSLFQYYSSSNEVVRGTLLDSTGGKSGGEQAKITYTVLAAALTYQFNISAGERNARSFRFIVVDEAFSKLDPENSAYLLDLLTKLKFQMLIITPNTGIATGEKYMSHLIFVKKESETPPRSVAYCYSIKEVRKFMVAS